MDETPEQAVLRGVREECGLDIRLLSQVRDAVQLVYSQAELTYFEKASTFFAAVVEEHQSDPSAKDHEVLWVVSSEAASLVSHESHRWAPRCGAR
jgi:ADP-ribose pyrophosphatase YjhB (NUDIX family)